MSFLFSLYYPNQLPSLSPLYMWHILIGPKVVDVEVPYIVDI
jgi:hypothetical protein